MQQIDKIYADAANFRAAYEARIQRLESYVVLMEDTTDAGEIRILEGWIVNIAEWIRSNRELYERATRITNNKQTIEALSALSAELASAREQL